GYNNASGHAARVYLKSGNHTINAPLSPLDDTTIAVVPAQSTLTVTHLQPSSVTLTKDGAGTLVVNNVRASSVAINAGKIRIIAGAGNAGVSKCDSVAVTSGAALDLSDSKLVTKSPIGSWNGSAYSDMSG